MSGRKHAGVKGMRDIAPGGLKNAGDVAVWHHLERHIADVMRRFSFRELRTPVLEETSLFSRSVGEETDIVGKEMYTFEDRGGRSLSLRPEGTAGAARAYIEHAVSNQEPLTRWYYVGPMFRYERMKTGRYRQFYQLGCEAFGAEGPAQDVEVIDAATQLLKSLGLEGIRLRLNSIGDATCRPAYREKLVGWLSERRDALCADCQRRLEGNPMRVLDCKNPGCREATAGAPGPIGSLCEPCRVHFDEVRRLLEVLEIPYHLDDRLVRGLDYYTRTAFELEADDPVLGTAAAVGGGGRYDALVETLGGGKVPAVGFAMGLDRLCLLLEARGIRDEEVATLFLVTAEPEAGDDVLRLVSRLRSEGVAVDFDPRGGSLKSQMKRADRSGARFALVLGRNELESGTAELKPLRGEGDAKSVRLDSLKEALAAELAEGVSPAAREG